MALRFTIRPRAGTTGRVLLILPATGTICTSVPVLCTPRTVTIAATEGQSAASLENRGDSFIGLGGLFLRS